MISEIWAKWEKIHRTNETDLGDGLLWNILENRGLEIRELH